MYIGQREIGTLSAEDPTINIIGSDDATTCHIVLIVDPGTKNCSLCHFDGTDVENGAKSMINSLKELNPNCESFYLYVAGGFDDKRSLSINLTLEIFRKFKKNFTNQQKNLTIKFI